MNRVKTLVGALLFLLPLAPAAGAADAVERLPDRWGLAFSNARSVNPPLGVEFTTISYIRDLDHGYVWHNDGPPALRFRAELTAGVANTPEFRTLVAANIIAVRYLDFLAGAMVRPYLEGGIGLIYTDFRVNGQGLRFNFDPQCGFGFEMKASPDTSVFVESRWHHISNAHLNHDNRGINSVIFTTGVLFK
ncbi:MAG: acyloxyacyl hydrolase [Deltaproteobacteria bacterium]|nr:acyloxyacyl hydrolase [Deltaproteobacteria bacterium]